MASPNKHVSNGAIQEFWSAMYFITKAGIEVTAETLLTEEDRRRLEPILASYHTSAGSGETQNHSTHRLAAWKGDSAIVTRK